MMQGLKRSFLSALDSTGFNSLLPRISRDRLLVLCYHGVVSGSRADAREGYENTVSIDEFARHLEWLGRHYRFVDLAAALECLERRDSGRPPVLITFDDGYRNNLSLAAPILRRIGAPAVFFLSTAYVGTSRLLWPLEMEVRLEQSPGVEIFTPTLPQTPIRIPGDRELRASLARRLRLELKALPNQERLGYLEHLKTLTNLDPSKVDRELHDFMSWDEARELAALGFDIASHTCEHPILSRLSEDELRFELLESKARIEAELGRPVTALAYPNGGISDYSPAVIAMAKACGYSAAFAVDGTFQKTIAAQGAMSRYALSRIIVEGHLPETHFHFLASGARNLLRKFV